MSGRATLAGSKQAIKQIPYRKRKTTEQNNESLTWKNHTPHDLRSGNTTSTYPYTLTPFCTIVNGPIRRPKVSSKNPNIHRTQRRHSGTREGGALRRISYPASYVKSSGGKQKISWSREKPLAVDLLVVNWKNLSTRKAFRGVDFPMCVGECCRLIRGVGPWCPAIRGAHAEL